MCRLFFTLRQVSALSSNIVLTSDGVPLQVSLAKAQRSQKVGALLLICPLLIFVLITFIIPIGDMLFRSIENRLVSDVFPNTIQALRGWSIDSDQIPDERVFSALASDFRSAVKLKVHTKIGVRLNYEKAGMASIFRKTGRKVKKWSENPNDPYSKLFLKAHKGWGDVEVWRIIKLNSGKYTNGYFLNAVDLKLSPEGIIQRPKEERLYLMLFERTLYMSCLITILCLLLGYPVAYLLASLPTRTANILLIGVLLPFWTSLLVRTSAWKVLLQQQGVVNDFLVLIGAVGDGDRLILINNQLGTIIAMTHILLPFMILPLFSVMKTISPSYVRAALSLGANPWTSFFRIYFPQSLPGIGAGSILVFVLAIGYYITPELVGGTKGTFISNRIAYHISTSLNWGLGAALGSLLLVVVMTLYWLYDRIVGIDNVKLG